MASSACSQSGRHLHRDLPGCFLTVVIQELLGVWKASIWSNPPTLVQLWYLSLWLSLFQRHLTFYLLPVFSSNPFRKLFFTPEFVILLKKRERERKKSHKRAFCICVFSTSFSVWKISPYHLLTGKVTDVFDFCTLIGSFFKKNLSLFETKFYHAAQVTLDSQKALCLFFLEWIVSRTWP